MPPTYCNISQTISARGRARALRGAAVRPGPLRLLIGAGRLCGLPGAAVKRELEYRILWPQRLTDGVTADG